MRGQKTFPKEKGSGLQSIVLDTIIITCCLIVWTPPEQLVTGQIQRSYKPKGEAPVQESNSRNEISRNKPGKICMSQTSKAL